MSRYSTAYLPHPSGCVSQWPAHERPGWDEWEDNNAPLLASLAVDGPQHKDTFLLDKDGDRIFRRALPIGFGRMEEWD